jgi:OOP family OmpA-OmpF porin
MKQKNLAPVIAALASLSPLAASAQSTDTGFYVGASLGRFDADLCPVSTPAGVTQTGCDDKTGAWKAFAGYQFHRNFAAEATYLRSRDVTASFVTAGTPFTIRANAEAYGLAALGILPVSQQFSVFGKLGILRTDAEARATVGGITVVSGEKNTGAHYGVGGLFNFTRQLGLRAEWEKADKGDFSLWSLGLQYKF